MSKQRTLQKVTREKKHGSIISHRNPFASSFSGRSPSKNLSCTCRKRCSAR
ncbi:hypothetical protein BofuT4_uP080190.1 [Botrytis cinerea T4]|uniref:Uncharacterized protein n=1 Tax=Botryotinia fuckeliana (strain T4) TaxID=999810 RepID=G2YKS6_BOTF4|nr:hypothetical protein BofuT4_uP080190.1 [Botrytis cinerea T4]